MEKMQEDVTRLKFTVFGNGLTGLTGKVKKLETDYDKISKQLLVIMIFTGILIIAQIPELIKLLGIVI